MDERQGAVTCVVLVSDTEGLGLEVGAEHRGGHAAVELAGLFGARLTAVEVVEGTGKVPVTERAVMGHGVERLLVDIFQAPTPDARRPLRRDPPGAAKVIEAVAEYAVVVTDLDVAAAGELALVDLAHLAQADVEVVQLADIQHGAFKELRQQTSIARADQRDLGEQTANLQFGLRVPKLDRARGFGEFVHRAWVGIAWAASTVVCPWQQCRTTARR
ncbi:hypothetical protein D3C76_827890 [compost metagenome]